MENGTPRSIKSTETVCEIIMALKELNGAGVTELAGHLGKSKGGVYSQLATLRQQKFVTKQGDAYHLSPLFFTLGEFVKDELGFVDIVKTEIDDLAAETGELAQFAIETHGELVFLIHSQGDRAVRAYSRVGRRDYLHYTALGKAMLAYYPEEKVDEIIEMHGLPERTENTITTRDDLEAELASVREQGFAVNDIESREGMRAVAAPVMRDGESVVGAVAVSAPANRLRGSRLEEDVPELILGAVNAIEVKLKYSG